MPSNFSQHCLAFDNQTAKTIGRMWIGASSFSLFVSLIVLVIVILGYIKNWKKWKKSYSKGLLLWFTMTIVFQGPFCIMQSAAINYDTLTVNKPLCIAAGVLKQYSSWLINLTILWIALYLFRLYWITVYCNSGGENRQGARSCVTCAIILALVIVIPVPFALIPLAGLKYGVVDTWCWIVEFDQNDCTKKDYLGIFYHYALWLVPFVLEVIVLITLSVVICFIFRHGYKKYHRHQLIQREYYYRMLEFLPLLVCLFIYSLFCVFQVVNFTTDILGHPSSNMWFAYVVIGQVKELVVLVGYLATLLVVMYQAKKTKKSMGIASTTKEKKYSTFELLTPDPKESVDSPSIDEETV